MKHRRTRLPTRFDDESTFHGRDRRVNAIRSDFKNARRGETTVTKHRGETEPTRSNERTRGMQQATGTTGDDDRLRQIP